MKKFLEHSQVVKDEAEVFELVEEATVPEEVTFIKKMFDKATGLSMKISKSTGKYPKYKLDIISPKGVHLGSTSAYYYDDKWQIFGSMSGVMMSIGEKGSMDDIKKNIENQWKKKFSGQRARGKETAKYFAKSRASKK